MFFSQKRPSQDQRIDEFESAALPHLKDLHRTAARLVGDRIKAEDVVQEVYLQAWKSFDRFQTGTNCRAWLFQILFNTLHHYRRKWQRPQIVEDADDLIERTAISTPSVPEHITDEEILEALGQIPQDFRAVVLLVDVEEFAYKETAGILNVPVGTVMSRLSRGRRLLRERLAGVADAYGIGRGKQQGATA